MKKRLTIVLTMLVAVCLALVGCGGGSNSSNEPVEVKPEERFIGLWEIDSMDDGETEYSGNEIEAMKLYGFVVYLDLEEDGSANLEVFGTEMEGEWEAVSSTKGSITLEGDPVEMRLRGSKLSLVVDDTSMTFVQIDPEDRIEAADMDELLEDLSSDLSNLDIEEELGSIAGSGLGDSEGESVPFSQTLVDDDKFKVEITAKTVDWIGYVGYELRVENKTDQTVKISTAYGTCSVDGKMCEPLLYETIRAGKYVETTLSWSGDDVANLDALKNVEGTIEFTDEDYETIATYDFKID